MRLKRGELTIFYIAHEDGVPNGYAENNRTKEVVRRKATGSEGDAASAHLLVCQLKTFRNSQVR
jgi:hypothetical protein